MLGTTAATTKTTTTTTTTIHSMNLVTCILLEKYKAQVQLAIQEREPYMPLLSRVKKEIYSIQRQMDDIEMNGNVSKVCDLQDMTKEQNIGFLGMTQHDNQSIHPSINPSTMFLFIHGRFETLKGCKFHSLSLGNHHEFTSGRIAHLLGFGLYVGELSKSSNFDFLVVMGDILLCGMLGVC
jgi:hypothetical protein